MLLGDVLEYNVRRAADRVAVVYGDRRWTYPELAERVRRLSRALAGVAEPRDRVALYAENTPEYVECYYGVPMSGMGLVFVNYRLTHERWSGSSPTPSRQSSSPNPSTSLRSSTGAGAHPACGRWSS